MSDHKGNYSNSSTNYIKKDILENVLENERYDRSKAREEKYGKNWEKNKVNLNDIVEKFCPNAEGKTVSGVKFVFKNENYIIECDKASGYLRIYDKRIHKYVKLDGSPGNRDETHFKIKKRSEM